MQLFTFDSKGDAFGTGQVQLDDVVMLDEQNRRLNWMVGGTQVILVITFSALAKIDGLIVGFIIKNRKGQVLFGDNNYLTHQDKPVSVDKGSHYRARFGLTMPYLPADDYAITVAIASGAQDDHLQHCWRHEALMFTVVKGHVVHGLMGIPLGFCDITPIVTDA